MRPVRKIYAYTQDGTRNLPNQEYQLERINQEWSDCKLAYTKDPKLMQTILDHEPQMYIHQPVLIIGANQHTTRTGLVRFGSLSLDWFDLAVATQAHASKQLEKLAQDAPYKTFFQQTFEKYSALRFGLIPVL